MNGQFKAYTKLELILNIDVHMLFPFLLIY